MDWFRDSTWNTLFGTGLPGDFTATIWLDTNSSTLGRCKAVTIKGGRPIISKEFPLSTPTKEIKAFVYDTLRAYAQGILDDLEKV